MYIYIKPEAVETLGNALASNDNVPSNCIVRYDCVGEPYLAISGNPFSVVPIPIPTEITNEVIDRFTVIYQSVNYEGGEQRKSGVYMLNNAKLSCEHAGSTHMIIDICAPTFELLRKIYFDFREGKLLPNENWETPQIEKSCWFRPTTWKIWS